MKKILLSIISTIICLSAFAQVRLDVWDKSPNKSQTVNKITPSKLPKSFESAVPQGGVEIYDKFETPEVRVRTSDGKNFKSKPIVYKSRNGFGSIVYTEDGWIGHYDNKSVSYTMTPNMVKKDTLPSSIGCQTPSPPINTTSVEEKKINKKTPSVGRAFDSRADFYNKNLIINKIVTLYIEVDYSIYFTLGSTLAATNYVNGLFANVAQVYLNEGINLQLVDIYIWTTPSPYGSLSTTNSQITLNAFDENMRINYPVSTTATLRHLITDKNYGGIARYPGGSLAASYSNGYDLPSFSSTGGIQPSSGVAVSGLSTIQSGQFNTVDLTTYKWPIEVVAHEIGHNMGSPHTHWCGWKNDAGSYIGRIDSCGSGSNEFNTNPPGTDVNLLCGTVGVGSKVGTVMSYCHINLTSDKNVMLTNGFGKYPRFAIRSFLYYSPSIPFTSASSPSITTTSPASSISPTSFVVSANITNDGGALITERGFCYSTSPNPIRGTNQTVLSGTGSGSFSNTITTSISANTTYYVRSYAINQAGLTYGNEITVTTQQPIIPTLTTVSPSSITNTSVNSGGTITYYGGANITSKGVVWSTSPNPTISLTTKTNVGSGNTNFTTSITGLSPSTTYYLRSYATNSAGTGYGNELTFTTLSSSTILFYATPVTFNSTFSVNSGATIQSDGGAAITSRGVCWNTSPNPTTSNNKTSNGTGIGTFNSIVTNLSASTTYYLRAYAVNSIGTTYSEPITFTTPALPVITLQPATNISSYDFSIPATWTLNSNNRVWTASVFISTNPIIDATNSTNSIRSISYISVFYGSSAVSGSNFKLYSNGNCSLSSLCQTAPTPGTTYYARMIAQDYGNDASGNTTNYFYSNTITITVPEATIPVCSTYAAKSPFANSSTTAEATLGSIVTNRGGIITERGVLLSSTNTTPTLGDSKFICLDPIKGYQDVCEQTIKSLVPNTTYYFRAFATNSAGTGYGAVQTFTTPPFVGPPTVTNNPLQNLTSTSVVLSANITDLNGGRCWLTNSAGGYQESACRGILVSSTCPTLTSCQSSVFQLVNNNYTNGDIRGTWSSTFTGLTPNTLYYARAYGIVYSTKNLNYTGYSPVFTFTTPGVGGSPIVSMVSFENVTLNSVILNGNVVSDNNLPVTVRGFCYSTSPSPTTSNSTVFVGSGLGTFNSTITGLSSNTLYYVRSFATNSSGTAYSDQLTFTTKASLTIATLGTPTGTSSNNTITVSSSVLNTGGSTVTSRGFCLNGLSNTGTCANQVTVGSGYGTFSYTFTNLSVGTVYYIKAFAINSTGTAYTTEAPIATFGPANVTTNSVTNIQSTSATSGGNVTGDGGSTITERGICYSTSTTPTTGGLRVAAPFGGTGTYTSNISGLLPGTLYYVRAYVINANGTYYGSQVTFTTTSQGSLPTLSTTSVTAITSTTATSGGNITSDGGSSVTERGIVWSTTSGPTISLPTKTISGSGSGTFTSSMTNLLPGTLYYIRAYAINASGTSYGNETTFTTSIALPTVISTNAATNITQTTAVSGGSVTSDGGSIVTSRGICWSTTTNPTVSLSTKTTDGSGIGIFTSNLSGLSPSTTYYVRAYATNSLGTGYGPQIQFTSQSTTTIPTVSTTSATNLTLNGATSGGNVTSDGGSAVTVRGVVWSTSVNPTVSLSTKTSDGTGAGTFTSTITGLSAATTYYYRAYATNSNGTAYGTQLTFTTVANLPTLTTTDATSITLTSASSGGSITSDGGSSILAKGVIWSTSPNPVVTLSTKTNDGTGIAAFNSSITGLAQNTLYYVRSYATNSAGTGYGNQITFTTSSISLPLVATTTASQVGLSSATTGGNVSSDGNSTVTARGVCYATSPNPTLSNSFTTDGTGPGQFTSNLTGLVTGQTYYVKAYATNGVGTAYGNEITFVTISGEVPTVSTDFITNITSNNATVIFTLSSAGGGTITEKGFVYSTNTNPTTSNDKVGELCDAVESPCGLSQYSFTFTSSLSTNTTYYVRAYAINEFGTAYGQELTFTTPVGFPTLNTNTITSITTNSAISGGNSILSNGGGILAKGVCWSTSQNPTVDLVTKTNDGSGTLNFTSSITGLSPNTTYFVRAYATNQAGTNYGSQLSFTTLNVALPQLTTLSVTSISATGGISGGNITSDGGSAVISRGVCWSTSQNPTVANSVTIDGSGIGSYSSVMSGLSSGITYYVRAYATTNSGTAYGSQVSFTTTSSLPTVTTSIISAISTNTATSGGNVTNSGGSTVTSRGVCWSTNPNPTISNSLTSNGSGTGAFTSAISGLLPSTVYYVRAYATNSAGTAYGNERNFTTTSSSSGSCAISGLVVTSPNKIENFAFNINTNCTSYTVNVCRYSNTNPSVPPTSLQTPVACAIRNNMSSYVPTSTEISNGVITRTMSPQPAFTGYWYSVDVTCNSSTCTGPKTTRSAYFYNAP